MTVLIDAKTLSDGHAFNADVCIIGAGPAGISLARELMKSLQISILLIDGGGVEFDADSQSLNEGTVVGRDYQTPAEVRRRQFGGTVNQWNTPVRGQQGAKFVPLDAIDFEKRDWMLYSGWPFDRAHLDPFYQRAHEMCGLGPFTYALDESDAKYRPFKFDPDQVVNGFYRMARPSVFTKDALEEFKAADNLTLCLNANAIQIEGGAVVQQIRLATLNGKNLTASAKQFVLASGAIENPRLLLASKIGNANDLVGRFLMDHPAYFFTELIPNDRSVFARAGFYDIHEQQGQPVIGRLAAPRELLEREKLLNYSMVLYPKAKGHASRGLEGLRAFRHSGLYGISTARRFRAAADVCLGSIDIARYALRKFRRESDPNVHYWFDNPDEVRRIGCFEPDLYLEQAPDPENRITLGPDRDRLGMARVEVHWRWGSDGPRTAERVREIIDGQLLKNGIGRLRKLRWPLLRGGSHHPTGTTRMDTNPRGGVVDKTCRVHGIANLYAAGASVFPTAGYANPMLTIVALSLRLADHLRIVAKSGI